MAAYQIIVYHMFLMNKVTRTKLFNFLQSYWTDSHAVYVVSLSFVINCSVFARNVRKPTIVRVLLTL